MADEPTKEQRYSCGCHVVDGVLVAECTQTPLSGEISAARHAVAKQFSAKCFRLAAQRDAEEAARKAKAADDAAAAKAKADADLKAAQAEVAKAQAATDGPRLVDAKEEAAETQA